MVMNVLKRKYKTRQEGEGYTRGRTGGGSKRTHWQKTLTKISEKAQQRKIRVSLQLSY